MKLVEESEQVDRLRAEGAVALYEICRKFVEELNTRLSQPTLVLDPPEWKEGSFDDAGVNLFADQPAGTAAAGGVHRDRGALQHGGLSPPVCSAGWDSVVQSEFSRAGYG